MKIKVPATSANIGSGFDVFGMAIELFNVVEAEKNATMEFINTGTYGDDIDAAPFFKMIFSRFQNSTGCVVPPLKIKQVCEIPPARGLGSSAAAVAAGLIIANEMTGKPLNSSDLVRLGVEIEGHPDNIVPCFVGGLVVSYYDGESFDYERFEVDCGELTFIVPSFKMSTEKMRQALPSSIYFSDAIENIKNSTQFIAKLAHNKFAEALKYTRDKLHQSYRIETSKVMNELIKEIERRDPGYWFVSGSGSTICSDLLNCENLPSVEKIIKAKICNNKLSKEHD